MWNIRLKEVGRLSPRSVHEISGSMFTLGCETLDRDFADYEKYREYIEPLGIKTIRLQGGWAKTEKVRGELDFSWLDRIIFDAVGRGLNILLETDYGNPVYPGGGGFDLGGGFPVSEEALAGWDHWVDAMARRYKGVVRDWAMWNEPDLVRDRMPEQIVDFNIRTARIIKSIIPDARIAGLSLASRDDTAFRRYMNLIREQDAFDLFDWFIYHGYMFNPDEACDSGCKLLKVLREFSPSIKLRQGENGCPSERAEKFALSNHDWTEFSQAKWDLRRYLGDIGNGMETAVFTVCDFNHTGREINRKGLLYADEDHNVIRPKMVYYAIQNMTSVFDDDLEPVAGKAGVLSAGRNAAFTFTSRSGKGNVLAYWDRTTVPGDNTEPETCQILCRAFDFECPVLVELISGKVYELPAENILPTGDFTILQNLPFADSPLVIAEKNLLKIAPSA